MPNSSSTELYQSDLRHINTASDSEVLLNVLAHELNSSCGSLDGLPRKQIFTAVTETHRRIEGAYAVVADADRQGRIVGFRDPHGIRPMVLRQAREPRQRLRVHDRIRKRGPAGLPVSNWLPI